MGPISRENRSTLATDEIRPCPIVQPNIAHPKKRAKNPKDKNIRFSIVYHYTTIYRV
jgi:hypothetical protein